MQAPVYAESAPVGSAVVRVAATDAECANSSCITYSLQPVDARVGDDNISTAAADFHIDPQTGLSSTVLALT